MLQTFEEEERGAAVAARRPGWLTALLAGLVLFACYVGLSFLNGTEGTLSTDVGGKLATLRVMEDHDTFTPDVGYWAGDADSTARMHGLFYTDNLDGRFVNVTTVPLMVATRDVYAAGGYRAALVWSMAGAVATAFAARSLARRSGGDGRRSWLAFWVVGLASPVALYALDLWEHAPGLALMSWGVVGVLEVLRRRALWPAAAAGLAFGAAFSMRTEAVVYGFVAVGVGCILAWRRQSFLRAVAAGALAAAGFGVMVLCNYLLEVATLGSSLRAGRASGTASTGGTDISLRVKEALTTTVGLFPSMDPGPLALGAVAMALIAWVVWRCSRPGDRGAARVAFAGVVALFALRAVDGLGFIPGLLVVAPFSLVAIVLFADRRVAQPARDATVIALVALPLVWWFQFSGGAVPQWGGRYALTSGLVLTAVGIGISGMVDRWLQRGLVVLSIGLAVFGLAWMSYRTHEISRSAETVAALDVPVVSAEPFWLRELGAVYDADSRWLSVVGTGRIPDATAVLDDAGERSFVLLWAAPDPGNAPPDVPGWRTGDTTDEGWLGVDFRLTTYHRE